MARRVVERRLASAAILGIVCVPALAEGWAPEIPGGQRAAVDAPAPEAGADRREHDAAGHAQPATPTTANQAVRQPDACQDQCTRPEQHEIDDLVAQQTSAHAAEEMVSLGWLQFWLAVGGALALLVTLTLTACATRAAVKANKIADITAKRQLRAYVFAGKGKLTGFHEDGAVTASVVIKNHGATPAYKTRLWILLDFNFEYVDCVNPLPPTISEGKMITIDLGPGADYRLTQKHTFPATTMAGIRDGKWVIYAYGEITYVDCFGVKQTGSFRYFYGGSAGLPADGEMSYGHVGNEYS